MYNLDLIKRGVFDNTLFGSDLFWSWGDSDRFFGQSSNIRVPKKYSQHVTFDKENAYVTIPLVGFEKDEIKISVVKNILKIYAKRKSDAKQMFLENEVSVSYRLSDVHVSEKISSVLKNGVLTVTVPYKNVTRAEETERTIKIE
jgi:HSP20 family molecular chaperone IbpA